jgi:hypothetical protein
MFALSEFIEANTNKIQQQSRLREDRIRTDSLPQRRKDAKFGREKYKCQNDSLPSFSQLCGLGDFAGEPPNSKFAHQPTIR